MEFFFLLAALAAFAAWRFKTLDQGRRIALLGSHLGKYQIEKLMESLTQGYLRALGEPDEDRRGQIFNLLQSTEQDLCGQFERLAADFARADAERTRVSRLPFYLPGAVQLFPTATFDMRQALALHARGIDQAVRNSGELPRKARAFTVSAELFLMQHSCHWFCKSRMVASARMQARHQTSYAQLVAAVTPETRHAYRALVGSWGGS
jgi:hypothetical protein